MTVDELQKVLEQDREHGLYKKSTSPYKTTGRGDLDAFILLNTLIPEEKDIVGAAEHDIIYLSVDPKDVAKVISTEQAEFLNDCGVFYQDDSLCLFV